MASDSKRVSLRRRTGTALAALTVASASVLLVAPAAHAAEDVITVDSNLGCDPDGTNAQTTLTDALEAANASSNPDGVKIVFAEGVGEISFGGTVCKMWDQPIGVGNELAGAAGARFVVDSDVPVTIDFTNLAGIATTTDADFAGIYVRSDNVVLENLANMQAGAAGIAIEGTNVTVRNIEFKDPSTAISEVGVALLNGATNVAITDSVFHSQWWSSILIDGSVANPTTVTNIVIDGIASRGVESGFGHLDIEDGAIVNGLAVTNSVFGAADESSTTHAVYVNPAVNATGLTYAGNSVVQGTGGEVNVFYFEGGAGNTSTFTNAVIDGNTFTGTPGAPLSRIIGTNAATWTGLQYTNNIATSTRGILMVGATITDSVFDGNTFTNTLEPAGATIHLQGTLADVTVSNNLLDTPWSLDGIRVQGTVPAENVTIEGNAIHDFYADGSRSSIAIIAPGSNSVVRGNELIQHLERAGDDLPSTLSNHWAVYVWLEASAADADTSTGWSILNNSVDGFDGWTDAPIVINAIGKTLVTGNTFGENTQGSFLPETENGRQWFVWNTTGLVNDKVQTFRAEQVVFDGANAYFTATQPAPEAGNTAATTPVTLHVYWTADDHAEVYLGAIEGVSPGQRLSIPTEATTGHIRVQTVDANGNTSQYSSIDQTVVVAPSAPAVTETGETTAKGTGQPGATFTVRNAAGEVVASGVVGEDGKWSASGLTCGTTYTVTQTVLELESAPTDLTTAACPTGGGTGGTGTGTGTGGADGALSHTGSDASLGGFAAGALLLLALGGAALALSRRRAA